MTVAELIEKLRQVSQDLEVHVMADLEKDLIDIASVHLVTKPFTDDPFVVIEVHHHEVKMNRNSELQDLPETEDHAPEVDKFLIHTEARETLGRRIGRWASQSLGSPLQPRTE